jgi:hypothetical protein
METETMTPNLDALGRTLAAAAAHARRAAEIRRATYAGHPDTEHLAMACRYERIAAELDPEE